MKKLYGWLLMLPGLLVILGFIAGIIYFFYVNVICQHETEFFSFIGVMIVGGSIALIIIYMFEKGFWMTKGIS